jgi:penicillin-binding protein 1B
MILWRTRRDGRSKGNKLLIVIVKERKPEKEGLTRRLLRTRVFKILISVFLVFSIVSSAVVIHYYNRYARIIDLKLSRQVFQNTAKIYSASTKLVTNLSGASRAKRRLVEFKDIPKVLVDAVTAGEDQSFLSHHGLDPIRIAGAFVSNLDETHRLQGGSTITQQLARNFFLTAEPTWRRKLSEAFIALILELRLSKEQIFTMYANEVYLGQRGSFSIHGFGEGSAAQFGKDLSELTLPEAATLAGIIPAPNAYSPSKHPDLAKVRRNLILRTMRRRGAITAENYEKAKLAELEIIKLTADATDAPYLIDFIRDALLKDYSEEELMNDGLSVYTTLDPDLQKAAVEAVAKGLTFVEEQFAARDKKKKNPESRQRPQAGLIALNPHTGEIKAMVGGTDYAASQYNRMTKAFRQPGSIFKPFVYAAALETPYDIFPEEASSAGPDIQSLDDRFITPLTTVMDAPKVFFQGGATYEPNNYKHEYRGLVTVRTALQQSLNLATIRVAERIGFDRVAALAKRMGLNTKIKGYPSVAIGAFEVTPIELAGAYTAFANDGRRIEPHALLRVVAADGSELKTYKYGPREVLRPEVAYLVTHMMEGVIDRGTGAGVRARGFKLPAAGKTGTSRDGWFAGYTKDLLVIAWVGFDDNSDLNLEGARSALPIWTDFMLKAYELYPVRDAARMSFTPPPGIEIVTIDADTLKLATPLCQNTFEEAFIVGTAPTTYCPLHSLKIAKLF